MNLTILGQTPSQKNSKQIFYNQKTKKPFITSNSIVKDWQKDAAIQLNAMYQRDTFTNRVQVDYFFYCKDNRKRDIDNMIASVNDALQTGGVLTGDNWQLLKIGSADAAIDKENPRVELTITELDI